MVATGRSSEGPAARIAARFSLGHRLETRETRGERVAASSPVGVSHRRALPGTHRAATTVSGARPGSPAGLSACSPSPGGRVPMSGAPKRSSGGSRNAPPDGVWERSASGGREVRFVLGGERRGEHGDRRREGVPARRCRAREPRLRVGREWADAALAARLRPAGRAGRRGRRLHRQRARERPFRHRVGGLNYREPARPGISSTARSPVSPRYGRCPETDSRPRSVGRHPSARPSPRLRDGATGAPRPRLHPRADRLDPRPAPPSPVPVAPPGVLLPPAALARCPLGLHPPPWPAVPVRSSAPDPGPASPVAALAPRQPSLRG